MKHQIVFLDRATFAVDFVRPNFPHDYVEYPETNTEEDLVKRLADATIAVTNKVKFPAHIIPRLPKLQLVAVAATGHDMVDKPACAKQNILVCNVRDYAVNTVPEHCLAMIFALRRGLVGYANSVRRGEWEKSSLFTYHTYPSHDVAGAVLGIVGFGSLGKSIAHRAEALGMKIVATDHHDFPGRVDLDTLLRQSDIVSLHCPLTPETKHMINATTLAKMKKTAILINTGRGGLVDSAALADALQKGIIGGAGVDVLSTEPPRPGSDPLLSYKGENLIITPHVAWASIEAQQGLVKQLCEVLEAFVKGTPRNVVTSAA